MAFALRFEGPGDADAIRALTEAAFAAAPHAGGNKAALVDGLRAAGALVLSLTAAVDGEEIVGHVAFSSVTIEGKDLGWFGLGPLCVRPDRQRSGIGTALVREGLERLRARETAGCVLVGNPAYYGRFGFRAVPGLAYPGVPDRYVLAHALAGEPVRGTLAFHPPSAEAYIRREGILRI